MTCECGICTRIRRWKAAFQIVTPEKQAVFDEMPAGWEAEATDATYYRGIIRGEWPGAQELLETALEQVKAKNAGQSS